MARRSTSQVALLVALLVALVAGAGCGQDESAAEDSSVTTAATEPTSEPTLASTAPSTATPDVTATVTVTATETVGVGGAGGGNNGLVTATVADLERALEAEIARDYPHSAPGEAICEGSGRLAEWSVLLCGYLPDEPAEFGGIHVSMLDGGRYAWGLAECCDGAPWADAYPPSLYCRDLIQPPPDISPLNEPRPEYHLSYGVAVYYWLVEGRPARMDADGNGRPCETVYPPAEVNAYWNSVKTL